MNLIDVSARLVVHLFRAVEDIDHHSKSASKILCRLGFSGSGGSGRCSSHHQMQGLRQGDVASIREWCDHQSVEAGRQFKISNVKKTTISIIS